ncbi:Os08g0397250 [Oryza sativa Japonica Group]|uniref:Os08g0397250 protein n=1 Tax=Oryza sativa subsp. japonica TaxID=39947 RepID=A0A0N7KPT5_ORYSJ|nr:hypothetical protein EE612_044098 [Oryza sativa]BAT05314.1 Os08g0397250 [Oryza sativa Japonica Group]
MALFSTEAIAILLASLVPAMQIFALTLTPDKCLKPTFSRLYCSTVLPLNSIFNLWRLGIAPSSNLRLDTVLHLNLKYFKTWNPDLSNMIGSAGVVRTYSEKTVRAFSIERVSMSFLRSSMTATFKIQSFSIVMIQLGSLWKTQTRGNNSSLCRRLQGGGTLSKKSKKMAMLEFSLSLESSEKQTGTTVRDLRLLSIPIIEPNSFMLCLIWSEVAI